MYHNKAKQELCERIAELELQIQFAKKFGLDYKSQEKELDELYIKLDGVDNSQGGKINV